VKFLTSQLVAALIEPEMRRNVRALARLLIVLGVFIVVFSVLFHVLMEYEGQDHSWLTGLYWTLTVMSTLGFGDITFHSDVGRVFTIVVLTTGIVLLLIVLPFAFIRYFYAPWLEARLRLTAPRELPPETKGHVVLCKSDHLALEMASRLRLQNVEYVVLEPDATRAVALHSSGIRVVRGEIDSVETYTAVRAAAARLIVANADDPTNTNITLTVRERAPDVPLAAIVADKDAIDILALSGATHVVPLKHRLGEQLAARVRAGRVQAQIVGKFKGLMIAELPANDAGLVGVTIRDTRVRERTGLNIVGYWERGHLLPARADAVLSASSVIVVVGSAEQVTALDDTIDAARDDEPVLVIGGGRVGRAVLRALERRGLRASVIETNPALRPPLERLAERVVLGDAANLDVMIAGGIEETPSVVLTTHDDATNIYLALYCRKLNAGCRIISRITHDRNFEAIHRAGADFVLGETALGVRTLVSILHNRELIVVGEDADVFVVPVPEALIGRTIAESEIGARTGLTAIGVQSETDQVLPVTAGARLAKGEHLLLLGSNEQRRALARWLEQ
jgi:voltage-gated potassium channel